MFLCPNTECKVTYLLYSPLFFNAWSILDEGGTINFEYATVAISAATLVIASFASAAGMGYTSTFDNSFGDNQAPKDVCSDEDADFKATVGG